MATLYISEYAGLGQANGVTAHSAQEPALAEQNVAIGGASVQSAAFNASTRFVRLSTDAICSVLFGVNPTAVATAKRLPAGTIEYFGVTPGHKVAVITNT